MKTEQKIVCGLLTAALTACNALHPDPPVSREEIAAYQLGPTGTFSVYEFDCGYGDAGGSASLQALYWSDNAESLPDCPEEMSGFIRVKNKKTFIGKTDIFPPQQGYIGEEIFAFTAAKSKVVINTFTVTDPTDFFPDPCARKYGELPLYKCTVTRDVPPEIPVNAGEE